MQVRGPLKIEDEVAYWRIQPVTPQLYAFRELDDTLARDPRHSESSQRYAAQNRTAIPVKSKTYRTRGAPLLAMRTVTFCTENK